MQFYLSVMFLGIPDKIHEEKRSFLDFENNWLRTDGRTDGPSYRDARTHLKKRMKYLEIDTGLSCVSFELIQ